MKKLIAIFLYVSALAYAQTTTPNIGLVQPADHQQNWGPYYRSNNTIIDKIMGGQIAIPSLKITGNLNVNGTAFINTAIITNLTLPNPFGTTQCVHMSAAGVLSASGTGDCGSGGGGGGGLGDPGSNGIIKRTALNTTAPAVSGTDYVAPQTTLVGYGITDAVPNTRTVNGKPLSTNVNITASDVSAFDLTGNNDIGAHYFDIGNIAAPASPASGKNRYYFKTGSGLCEKTSGGVETCFGSGGGGSVSSVTGDSALFTNSGSTGAVTLTLGNALAHRVWGNNTGSTGTPAYVQLACADLSNASASCSTDATNAANISSGTLPNTRLSAVPNSVLANSSVTLNGTSVALGASANIPLQVNGVNQTSQVGINHINSSTNSVGLAVTFSNPGTNQVKAEITGTYNGTASALAANGANCGAGNAPLGVDAAGNAEGCFPVLSNPMTVIGDMVGATTSGAPARIQAGLTGQTIMATNSATPSFTSPGISGRAVTGTSDSILCDSGTALQDRGKLVVYNSASAVTVTVPDAGSSGCGQSFFFAAANQGAGTVTFNRTTSSTFTTFNGSAVSAGQTSFSLSQGQHAIVNSPDNSVYQVRIVTGGGGGGVSSITGDSALISNSGSSGAVTLTVANAAAHKYWGNNTGSTGAPGYVSLVAADLPSTLSSGTAITNAALTTPNLGTPSAATLTNATGLPISTGVSGLGTGVATFLATPSSANLLAALTTKNGTGLNLFDTNSTITMSSIGTSTGTGLRLTGSTLTAGNIYYQASGGALTAAKADSATTMPGICIADSTTTCIYSGVYRFSASQSWTVGGPIYVSASSAGALTQTAPSTSGNQVQRVGIALANDTILIMPSIDVGEIQ